MISSHRSQGFQGGNDGELGALEEGLHPVGTAERPDGTNGTEDLEAEGIAPPDGAGQYSILCHAVLEKSRPADFPGSYFIHEIEDKTEGTAPSAEKSSCKDGENEGGPGRMKRLPARWFPTMRYSEGSPWDRRNSHFLS